MNDLATHQRDLLALIKGSADLSSPSTSIESDDPYIRMIAGSPQLQLVREIALWWRGLGIESYCVLTARLLKRLGEFDAAVQSFFARAGAFAFIEDQGQRFLEFVVDRGMTHPAKRLTSSVAAFELAMLRVKSGLNIEASVEWDHDPHEVLQALLTGAPLGLSQSAGEFRTNIARRFDSSFEVVRCGEFGHST